MISVTRKGILDYESEARIELYEIISMWYQLFKGWSFSKSANHYPLDNSINFDSTCQQDCDLSSGWRSLPFEKQTADVVATVSCKEFIQLGELNDIKEEKMKVSWII